MTAADKSPISVQKMVRKPLQPRNIYSSNGNEKTKPVVVWNDLISFLDSNKENQCQRQIYTSSSSSKAGAVMVESIDPSLAEELSAVRQKLERIKLEKEKTDKVLKERSLVLDMKMMELQSRGEIQKMMEIEVDRLFRLKELQISCMRISPIRSLREKEGGGRTMNKSEEQQSSSSKTCDSIETSPPQTPISDTHK